MCKREIRFVDIWFVRHSLWYCLDWLRFWATFLHQDEWPETQVILRPLYVRFLIFPTVSHHFTGVVLYIWGVFEKVGCGPWPLTFPAGQQNTLFGQRSALVFWVLDPKVLLLKVAARPQDRCNTCLCKRELPNFLEFGELGNLATLTKCWGKIAGFVQWITSKFVEKGHFQPGPAK